MLYRYLWNSLYLLTQKSKGGQKFVKTLEISDISRNRDFVIHQNWKSNPQRNLLPTVLSKYQNNRKWVDLSIFNLTCFQNFKRKRKSEYVWIEFLDIVVDFNQVRFSQIGNEDPIFVYYSRCTKDSIRFWLIICHKCSWILINYFESNVWFLLSWIINLHILDSS